MQYIRFTKETKVFFWVFFAVLLLSVLSAYYKYMVLEDYKVFLEYDASGNLINIEDY